MLFPQFYRWENWGSGKLMPCPNLCSLESGWGQVSWLPARKCETPFSEHLVQHLTHSKCSKKQNKTVVDWEDLCHSSSHPPGAAWDSRHWAPFPHRWEEPCWSCLHSPRANPTNTDSIDSIHHRARLPFPQALLTSLCPHIHLFNKYLLNTCHMPDTPLAYKYVWPRASVCG